MFAVLLAIHFLPLIKLKTPGGAGVYPSRHKAKVRIHNKTGCQIVAGITHSGRQHAHIHTWRQFKIPQLTYPPTAVFGLWEEAKEPGENPCRLYQKGPRLDFKPRTFFLWGDMPHFYYFISGNTFISVRSCIRVLIIFEKTKIIWCFISLQLQTVSTFAW